MVLAVVVALVKLVAVIVAARGIRIDACTGVVVVALVVWAPVALVVV